MCVLNKWVRLNFFFQCKAAKCIAVFRFILDHKALSLLRPEREFLLLSWQCILLLALTKRFGWHQHSIHLMIIFSILIFCLPGGLVTLCREFVFGSQIAFPNFVFLLYSQVQAFIAGTSFCKVAVLVGAKMRQILMQRQCVVFKVSIFCGPTCQRVTDISAHISSIPFLKENLETWSEPRNGEACLS